MTDTSNLFGTTHDPEAKTARRSWRHALAAGAAALAVAGAAPALGATAGDTFVYRLSNGYNNVVLGQIQYRVESVDATYTTMSVTTDTPSAGVARTEVYTNDGNWARRPVSNHDRPVEYDFAPAFPAYVFPIEPGKSWSMRVAATNPATGRRSSVRVDGDVLGTERIRVPAGEFDTIKVRRNVYAGDWDSSLGETHITEFDWYAPALGRAVRTGSSSAWLDMARCSRRSCGFRGDWNVFELVEANIARK